MTRIDFQGQGEPIPTTAIPTNETDETGAFWVVLEDGVPFKKRTWLDQGYTNFDVFCVGGAGGRGGIVSDFVEWPKHLVVESLPSEVAAALATAREIRDQSNALSTPSAPLSIMVLRYPAQATGRNHFLTPHLRDWGTVVASYTDPTLTSAFVNPIYELGGAPSNRLGGGGGGGGLFKFSGVLEELPDEVATIMGKAGKRGLPGHYSRFDHIWRPLPWFPMFQYYATGGFITGGIPIHAERTADGAFTGGQNYYGTRVAELNAAIAVLFNYDTIGMYDDYPGFEHPKAGEDGGFTSFGDLAIASGGMGGAPAIQPIIAAGDDVTGITEWADGGEGGIGGRSEAGGGAIGSSATTAAQDGNWDGQVGEGGGGGHPGSGATSYGSQGSYGFDDPSVYGPRGMPETSYQYNRVYDADTGELVSETRRPETAGTVPGVGGGAGLNKSQIRYGSAAQNGHADGAIVVRLSTAI